MIFPSLVDSMDTLGADIENENEVEKPDPILKAPELYLCAKENQTDEVLAMLNEGVPPFFFDRKTEWTALHWASVNGNAKMVKKLLEAGADKSVADKKSRTPLQKCQQLEKDYVAVP